VADRAAVPEEAAVSKGASFSPVTRDACSLCAPLGATLAFAGVRGGMTLLHGSQGCATYIRRYSISHFREPLDAASSGFSEEAAVFGGRDNLRAAFLNVVERYDPEFVGVATTCLAETIGENAASALRALEDLVPSGAAAPSGASGGPDEPRRPLVAAASTPSYRGDQREGFRAATRAIVEAACPASGGPSLRGAPPWGSAMGAGLGAVPDSRVGTAGAAAAPLAVFPAMLSPADLRELKRVFAAFGLDAVLVSDYSDSLDGGPWRGSGRLLPEGGTPVPRLRGLERARYAIELGTEVAAEASGAAYLAAAFGAERIALGLPVGVEASDRLLAALARVSGRGLPAELRAERERLVDSYVDAHKIVFERSALIYGDRDLRAALSAFLAEIGMRAVEAEGEGRGFDAIEAAADAARASGEPVDLLIGSSKGYKTAKRLGVPLVRVGFPIHDRFGGQRVSTLCYRGTQELFDRVVNAIVETRQEESDVGYTYF
jgi:nitrogenase molybdenum-iron protein NifN